MRSENWPRELIAQSDPMWSKRLVREAPDLLGSVGEGWLLIFRSLSHDCMIE